MEAQVAVKEHLQAVRSAQARAGQVAQGDQLVLKIIPGAAAAQVVTVVRAAEVVIIILPA
jgi:hypothetical protein